MSIDFKPGSFPGETIEEGGITWEWDGEKWNRVDEGPSTGEYLGRYGDKITDASRKLYYSWNKDVEFKSEEYFYIEGGQAVVTKSDQTFVYSDDQYTLWSDDIQIRTKSPDKLGLSIVNGKITTSFVVNDASPNTSLTTKKYVDDRDSILQSEVVILQEEINAIAPYTDRGIWKDDASASPAPGHFAMRTDGGLPTQDYTDDTINTIVISKTDYKGDAHGFTKDEVGDQIQLFDIGDENYGLFEVISKTETSDHMAFGVIWLQGRGETHPEDDVLIRLFKTPTGGIASEFVLKDFGMYPELQP
jgi:hypothetical protein